SAIVVDDGMPETARAAFASRGIAVVPGGGRHPLDVLRDVDGTDAAVIFPCNGQWDPRDISRLLIALNLGHDMVIASRFMVGGARRGQRGNLRSLGNRVFNFLADLLFA